MKKVLLIASMAMVSFGAAHAQSMSIAPEAGINLSNLTGDVEDTKMKLGFRAGANVNIPMGGNFYLAPGLFYTTKGAKTEVEVLGVTTTTNTTLGYLELPVNVMYRQPVGEGAVFFSAGPYVAYGIAGKAKWESSGGGTSMSGDEKIEWGTETGETNPLDFGLNAGVGYEAPFGLYIRAQYGLGLGNLSNVDDVKVSNSNIQISLGYNLWTFQR